MAINNVLKDKLGKILNPKIPRYEILKYNLITDGSPVKTGRKVDGKDEYIKRIGIAQFPNNTSLEVNTDLNVNEINVTDIKCLGYKNSDRTNITVPFISMAGTHIGLNTKVINNILYLLIETTIDRTGYTGWAEVSFIYK